jgi:hypothetical protein
MNRRTFLSANGALLAGFALTKAIPVLADTSLDTGWRTFEVVSEVELLKPDCMAAEMCGSPINIVYFIECSI